MFPRPEDLLNLSNIASNGDDEEMEKGKEESKDSRNSFHQHSASSTVVSDNRNTVAGSQPFSSQLPLTPVSQSSSWEEKLKETELVRKHAEQLIEAGLTQSIVEDYSREDVEATLVEALKWNKLTATLVAKRLKLMVTQENKES